MVALGESLVALGVGVAEQPVSVAVFVASILGVGVAVSLWWLYLDVDAHTGEEALARADEQARSRLARDCYTYLHFPIVVSVIFIALGLKKVLEYVADTEHHDLSDALTGVPLLALYGGVAVHLLGHVGFRRRSAQSWNVPRLLAAAVLALLAPVAWQLPALAALGIVAGVLAVVVGYEFVRFGSVRAEVRHRPGAAV